MSRRVEVVCRGTFTDRATGETIHGHERAVCHTFTVARFRDRDLLLLRGNQLLTEDDAEFPDDFELLDEHEGGLRDRLAINCPVCGRGLTCARDLATVAGIVKALTRHDRPELDIESLRAYVVN